MSINICDIDFKTCEKSKKYKRSDIDEIARKCGINPNEYKSRKTLCEAIVAKNNGDIPAPKSTKTSPNKKSADDCDIPQNICEKSKKYNRENINDIAQKCGIDNPKKFKSRKELCMAILEKRGVKTSEEEPKKTEPKKTVSPKCNKKSLENCLLKDLQIIAKEENIKNYSGKKKDELIQYIKETRQKRKNIRIVSSDEDEEEPVPVEPEIPSDEEEIPVKPKKKESPKKEVSKDCDKKTLENCKATDLAIIAKEENIKNYSKYKKEELKNFIKKVRKNRKGIYEDSEDEDVDEKDEEEDADISPMSEKKLRKIIKEELQKIGTFDVIESRFKTIGPLRKYVVEEIKKEYPYFDDIIKDFDFKNIFKEIIVDMKEEYEEDDKPILTDKKREAREQREREAREQIEREAREQIEREAREQRERESREQREREAREQREREAREQREREQREAREQREREAREQREREVREREQREAREREQREVREREQRDKKVVFRSPLESSQSSIEDDEDLFMEDLYIDVEQMDISPYIIDYMNNTLIKISKEDLLKIYRHIFSTQFNPNRQDDLKKINKKEIITDIIGYIQQLSESFFYLYEAIGDKRYQSPDKTDELAIKKYDMYDLQELINTLYKRYSKDIVIDFEINMLKFFLRPWQKVNEFIKKPQEIPKVEFPRGDIEDVLYKLQKPTEMYKECNPYEEKFCEDEKYCDITDIPGKCISKDVAEKSEMTKIKYKGYNIIGDPVSIDKLYEFGVPFLDQDVKMISSSGDEYNIEPSDIFNKGDKVRIIKTKEYGKVFETLKNNKGEKVILVEILPEGNKEIFKYDEIIPVDYIEEEPEKPKETEIIEDLEEKEAKRLKVLEEMLKKRKEDLEEKEAKRLKEIEEMLKKRKERERRTREYLLKNIAEETENKERERIRMEKIREEEERKEREEEEMNKKEKIRYDNIDTLLSEIQKRNVEDVDNIDIVNNQILKCLGLVA